MPQIVAAREFRHPTGVVFPLPPGWRVRFAGRWQQFVPPDGDLSQCCYLEFFIDPQPDQPLLPMVRSFHHEGLDRATIRPVSGTLPSVRDSYRIDKEQPQRAVVVTRARGLLFELHAQSEAGKLARREAVLDKIAEGLRLEPPVLDPDLAGVWRGQRMWQSCFELFPQVQDWRLGADGRAQWSVGPGSGLRRRWKTHRGRWFADQDLLCLVADESEPGSIPDPYPAVVTFAIERRGPHLVLKDEQPHPLPLQRRGGRFTDPGSGGASRGRGS